MYYIYIYRNKRIIISSFLTFLFQYYIVLSTSISTGI